MQTNLFEEAALEETEPEETKWNRHQEEIFGWARAAARGNAEKPHARIRARAGTGKTTTALEIARIIAENDPSTSALFCSFSRDIADEISGRLPEEDGFEASTIHSLGYGAIRRHTDLAPSAYKVNRWKYLNQIENWAADNYADYDTSAWEEEKWQILRVLKYTCNVLADPEDPDSLKQVANAVGVPLRSWSDGIPGILARGAEMVSVGGEISYTDMVYYPCTQGLPMPSYDWVIIDEAQDLNPAQRTLIGRMIGEETRSVWVGDENQAIFQFQGAKPEGFLNVVDQYEARTFQLPVSYRCPELHVKEASRIVPDIEAPEEASRGTLEVSDLEDFYGLVRPGDVVLSRRNAPLVRRAVGMVQRKRPAEIVGKKTLSKQLTRIINMVVDDMLERGMLEDGGRGRLNEHPFKDKERPQDWVIDYEQFPRMVNDWSEKRREKLSRQGAGKERIQIVTDKEECILACYDGFTGASCPAGLKEKLRDLFKTRPGRIVQFSTVHKAKGKEFDRVHIIDTSNMPMEIGGHRPPGEMNVKYVCLTRSSRYINIFGHLWGEREGVSVGDPLPEEEFDEATDELKSKLAKLLRKASSTNYKPEERAFRSKAEELMEEYDLTRSGLKAEGYRIETSSGA